MNLSKRIETLENKRLPGYGVYVLFLEEAETHEHAEQRYCDGNGITRSDFDNRCSELLVIFVDKC